MTQTFEELVLPHYDTYIKMATKWCYGDAHRAEDMVQEAMAKALIHFPEYDPKYKITTWFHAILRNIILDTYKVEANAKSRYLDYFMWKRNHPAVVGIDGYPYSDGFVPFDGEEDFIDFLPELIEDLSETDRCIITMYMSGVPQLEIGRNVGMTRANVAFHIRKICKHLRERLIDLKLC